MDRRSVDVRVIGVERHECGKGRVPSLVNPFSRVSCLTRALVPLPFVPLFENVCLFCCGPCWRWYVCPVPHWQLLFYSLLFLTMSGMSQVISRPGHGKRCLAALFPSASVVSLRAKVLGYLQIRPWAPVRPISLPPKRMGLRRPEAFTARFLRRNFWISSAVGGSDSGVISRLTPRGVD